MEKERFFGSNWQSPIMPPEMNCAATAADQLPQHFLNVSWEQPMDHGVQFESALASLVSSPAGNSNAVIHHEFNGRLGSVCNAGEISPALLYYGAKPSCHSTPLSSAPKLNLSMTDHQHQGEPGNQMAAGLFAPFAADLGFVERATRFSRSGTSHGGLGGQFGLPEAGKLSRVASSQSLKAAAAPQVGVPDNGVSGASTPDETEFGSGQESSSASERMPTSGAEKKASKRKAATKGKLKESTLPSSNTNPPKSPEEDNSDAKKCKLAETSDTNKDPAVKPKTEQNGIAGQKQGKEGNAKPPEPPKDYIHVRARRGQATDSHSLAERVRREKISERMKLLQDLVPGCNKITGKALMLDEIINYVQSLQRQVEFLSTKLATLNLQPGFNRETLLPRDMHREHGPLQQQLYPLDYTSIAFSYSQQPQEVPLESAAANGLDMQISLNPLDGFTDAASQLGNFWEDDLQYVVQMGFGQSQGTALCSQSSCAE